MRRRALVATSAAALLFAGALAAAAAAAPTLTRAAISKIGGAVEIRLTFDAPAPRWTLSAHGDQLWLDFSRARSLVPPRPLFGEEQAPIKLLRVIDRGAGQVRIVIEVEGKTDYAIARFGHEVVLRAAGAGTVANLAAPLLAQAYRPRPPTRTHSAGFEPPGLPRRSAAGPATISNAGPEIRNPPPPEISAAPGSPLPAHPLVMIDPGHGGYDPGTMSASGLRESDLALEIAKRLRRALGREGIRAEMTRTTDVFIPLPERTRTANRADADLFVSIHLNSSPNRETTGIEVFYLNNTTDRATIRLARMENGGAPPPYGTHGGANLNYILTDLRQQYKAIAAASLARMIDTDAVAELDSGLGIKVNGLGARKGPFYVLVGANMPAVLIECGFLSNPGEAVRLASPQYQKLLALGIASAIAHYFHADASVGNL